MQLLVVLLLMLVVVDAAFRKKRQSYAYRSQFATPPQQPQYDNNNQYQQPQNYRPRCGYCRPDSFSREPLLYQNPAPKQDNTQNPENYDNAQPMSAVVSYGGSYDKPTSGYSRPTNYGRPQNIPYSLPRGNDNLPTYSVSPGGFYQPQVAQSYDNVEHTYENQPIRYTVPIHVKSEPRLVESVVTTQQPIHQLPEISHRVDAEAKRLGERIEETADGPRGMVPITKVPPSNHVISARAHPAASQLKPSETENPPLVIVDGESTVEQQNITAWEEVTAPTRTMLPEVHPPGWNGRADPRHPAFWPPRNTDFQGPPDGSARAQIMASHTFPRGPPGF